MPEFHQEKTESLLARLVGEFLAHEAGPSSLITVTHVAYNEKAKQAAVFMTVLPETKEAAALAFAKRQSSDLREYVREHAKLRVLPVFSFAIDFGEKNRQRVDEISSMDAPQNADQNAGTSSDPKNSQ